MREELTSTLESIPLDLVEQTTITHDMTLQRSIALIGQQVPVIVHRDIEADPESMMENKTIYRIHAGQRRVSALRELGEDTVLARVYTPDLDQLTGQSSEYAVAFQRHMAKITAAENLVRGANAGAEADALWALLDDRLRADVEVGDLRDAVNEISAQTGLGRTQIKALIDLRSSLSERGLHQLRSGEISVSTAKQLARLTRAEQTALIEDGGKVKLKDIQEVIRLKRSAEQTEMFDDLPALPTPVDPHQALIDGIEGVIAHGGLDDFSSQTLTRAVQILRNHTPAAVAI
jgi:hypothetical protein